MSGTFPNQVRHALAPLIESGELRVVEEETANSFDNAAVVLHGDALRLRVIRERGTVFADLAPPHGPPDWISSVFVNELLTGAVGDTAVIELVEFRDWLAHHLPELRQRLGLSQRSATLAQLRRLQEASARRRFGL